MHKIHISKKGKIALFVGLGILLFVGLSFLLWLLLKPLNSLNTDISDILVGIVGAETTEKKITVKMVCPNNEYLVGLYATAKRTNLGQLAGKCSGGKMVGDPDVIKETNGENRMLTNPTGFRKFYVYQQDTSKNIVSISAKELKVSKTQPEPCESIDGKLAYCDSELGMIKRLSFLDDKGKIDSVNPISSIIYETGEVTTDGEACDIYLCDTLPRINKIEFYAKTPN